MDGAVDSTADICDAFRDLQVAEPRFRHYGGQRRFAGPAETIWVDGGNLLLKTVLSEPGGGRVLVVDGRGRTDCALVGDRMAALAVSNGWSGIVVNGMVRDSAELLTMTVGVYGLGLCPKRGPVVTTGERSTPVRFAGLHVSPGDMVICDDDGLVVVDATVYEDWLLSRPDARAAATDGAGSERA